MSLLREQEAARKGLQTAQNDYSIRKGYTMKAYIVAILIGAVLATGFVVAFRPSNQRSYADFERDRIAVEQAQTLAPVWVIAQAMIILGIPALLLAAGGAAVYKFFRKPRTVRPDQAGRLPVLLSDGTGYQAAAVAALADYHATQRTAAAVQPVPHSYHYSYTHNPHTSASHGYSERAALVTPSMPDLIEQNATPVVPTFHELFTQGVIGSQRPLLFGYADGQPITGTLKSLYSCGIGGGQGSGKTSVALYLAVQTALQGGELVVIDPHGDAPSGLGQRIQPLQSVISGPVAVEPRDVLNRLSYTWNIFKDRQRRGSEHEHPVLLIIDEWTALLRRDMAQKLPVFLADLAIEGRKYGVYAVLCSHRWSVEATGGADVRNMLTAHFVARNRSEEVKMQTGFKSSALPADPLLLEPGQTIFVPNAGSPSVLTIPYISEKDIIEAGATLTPRTRTPRTTPAEAAVAAGTRDVPVQDDTHAAAPVGLHYAGTGAPVGAGTPHQDAVPTDVLEQVHDTSIDAADEQAGALSRDIIRGLYEAGWTKTRIAEYLRGTKSKRLAAVEAALQE